MAMLRSIDVIFKNPSKKFTVIYQDGKLWQLNRLDFDGKSLTYKRPYTGSREQIFVAQDQSLPDDDLLLRSQLATIALPASIIGRNADEFEHWWRYNGHDYQESYALAKAAQQHAKAQLTQSNLEQTSLDSFDTPLPAPLPSSDQHSLPSQTDTPTPANVQQKLVAPDAIESTSELASDDIFDQMMGELTQTLR